MNYTIKKYDGDDRYSWAVFKRSHVKNIKGVVMYGKATPIVAGLSKSEAIYYKRNFEADEKSKKRC
jgi:hypothetical protein